MAVSRNEELYGPSPHGPIAHELGIAAIRAADALADEPEWRGGTSRRWLLTDYVTFDRVMEFAHQANEANGHLDLHQVDDLYPEDAVSREYPHLLSYFHTALPFSETERHWMLHSIYFDTDARWDRYRPAEKIRAQTHRGPLEAGLLPEIHGEKLIDAFWAWRRDIFEFESAHSLDSATDTLRGIAQILMPHIPELQTYRSIPTSAELTERRDIRRIHHEHGAATGRRRAKTTTD